MEDNNFNGQNQMGSNMTTNITPSTPVNTGTPVMGTPIQSYGQYQPPTQTNNSNSNGENNAKKKGGPIIIFGLVFLIAIVLVITLFMENKDKPTNESSNLITDTTKSIVVYFSKDGENYGKNLDIENKRTLTEGNTSIMAKRIAGFIEADLFEIVPLNPYPDDLQELYAATKVEYNKDTYPEIKNKIADLDNYDVVFIGYLIWHASYPQIIKTFVRDNKSVLKNKIIIPFNTHAGSGSAGTYKKLFSLIGSQDNKSLNGLAINGTEVNKSDDSIKSWLKGLGYKIK